VLEALEPVVLEVPVVDELADELVDGSVCVAVVPVVVLWSLVVCGCATIGVAVSSAVTAAIGTYRMVMMMLSVSRWLQRPCLRAVSRHAGPATPSCDVRRQAVPRRRYCKRRRELQAAHWCFDCRLRRTDSPRRTCV
jgi:hypothetical protein